MARESFIFYASFYDALKELPNDLRLEIFDAVCAYALNGEEPELTGVAKAIFTLIKPPLAASVARYENGCKGAEYGRLGGRPKKTPNEPQGEENGENENPNETPKKPQENPNETPKKPPYKDKDKERDKDLDINPPISPLTRGEGDAKTAFFEKYPALKGKRVKDDGIDYVLLDREFEQSAKLRGMYSFAKVVQMYDAIARGDFRDKPSLSSDVLAANAKSAREKWYADRQAKADAVAYGYLQTARRNTRFVEIERELQKLNLTLAKAEVAGADLTDLKDYQDALKTEQARLLDKMGLTAENLQPQYHCQKCKDSGYQEDGRACDCYKGVVAV